MTDLKSYIQTNDITQKELCKETGLAVSCMHRLVNTGKGSRSVKKLVYYHLKSKHHAKFTEKEFMDMLQEND